MSRSALIALVTCFISLVPVLPAAATASMDQTAGDPRSRLDPDRKHLVFLNPAPVVSISGPTGGERDLLTKIGYRNWRFQEGTAPAGGSFNLLQYGAFALTTLGGANLSVLYNDGIAARRTNYDWVQFGFPTNWGSKGSKPFVDSTPINNKNSPFYDSYTTANLPTGRTPTRFFANGGAIWLDTTNYPQQNIQNPTGSGGRLAARG